MTPKIRSRPDSETETGKDIVEIRFLQDANSAAPLRYFRDTLIARAPDSIFAHHFGRSGINDGKQDLPTNYTLDRDPDIFRRFFDPWLRGYPGPSPAEWNALSEGQRQRISIDADCYNFPRNFWQKELFLGRPVLSWAEAIEALKHETWGVKKTKLANENERLEYCFEPSFLIRSESTYYFAHDVTMGKLVKVNGTEYEYDERVDDNDCARAVEQVESTNECTNVLLPDPEERSFWKALKSLVDGTTGCERYHFYFPGLFPCSRGSRTDNLLYNCIKHGVEAPEIGLESRNLITELSKAIREKAKESYGFQTEGFVVKLQCPLPRPLIHFRLKLTTLRQGEEMRSYGDELFILFMDEETARMPRDKELLDILVAKEAGKRIHQALDILNCQGEE